MKPETPISVVYLLSWLRAPSRGAFAAFDVDHVDRDLDVMRERLDVYESTV
jgi:hypothetical protein